MQIRTLTLEDLPKAALIHLSAFPKSALSLLGAEVVRRYYEWQLTGPHQCLAIGAVDDTGQIVGFCFGGIFHGALSGFVEKNKKYLVMQVLKRPWLLITNPIFRDRVQIGARLRSHPNTPAHSSASATTPEPSFGILSIAVHASAQRQGIGQLLMHYSEAFAHEHGFRRMHLTVAVDNLQAIQFYQNEGWEKHLAGTTWKGSMIKCL